MEKKSNNWSHLWFGFWNEYREEYAKYPSIKSFIDKEINKAYKKESLLNYLKSGYVVTVTSKAAFPNPFTQVLEKGDISVKTDGKWLWLDNICEFIEFNNLILPENFYKHIQNNNFVIPEIESINPENLDWPL